MQLIRGVGRLVTFKNNDKLALWVVDIWCDTLYNKIVIKTFKDDETQNIYRRRRSRRLPSDIQQVALRKLRMINNAISINDLRVPPANHLEKLGGNRAGQWSIRINDQWRVCFEWQGSDAYNVEVTDYH
ncbi:MAG: type II toxin-antitoxin system RelE/ParE family toxin [Anaerolineales bacterium]|nr:type II toxin-antitoxin system RelE/ParE family toxin [Anaerolineales bacterium]